MKLIRRVLGKAKEYIVKSKGFLTKKDRLLDYGEVHAMWLGWAGGLGRRDWETAWEEDRRTNPEIIGEKQYHKTFYRQGQLQKTVFIVGVFLVVVLVLAKGVQNPVLC